MIAKLLSFALLIIIFNENSIHCIFNRASFLSQLQLFRFDKLFPLHEQDLSCVQYGNNLSSLSSTFLECALNSSRPINICRNCVQYYLQFQNYYNEMMNVRFKKNSFALFGVIFLKFIQSRMKLLMQRLYMKTV